MGKIRVTENELKQIINESVKSVLVNEYNAAKRQQKYNDRLNAYNQANRDWSELTPEEQKQYTDIYGNAQAAENAYMSGKQVRVDQAQHKLNRATRRNGGNFKTQLDAANKKLAQTQANIKAASQQITQALANALKGGVTQLEEQATTDPRYAYAVANAQDAAFPGLSNILAQINQLQTKIAELNQLHQAIGSKGNIQLAQKTIKTWKANSVKLAQLQKQQAAQGTQGATQSQAPAAQPGAMKA